MLLFYDNICSRLKWFLRDDTLKQSVVYKKASQKTFSNSQEIFPHIKSDQKWCIKKKSRQGYYC